MAVDTQINLHVLPELITMQMLHNSGVGGPRAAANIRLRELAPLKKIFDEFPQRDWDAIDKALRIANQRQPCQDTRA